MRILICEDDLITLKALEYSLRKEGYDVLVAGDGRAGADLLRRYAGEIDMMITDHHMPYNSGLELVHIVRNELNYSFPVIMLTRVNLEDNRDLAISLGVNEYITKPFLPKQLVSRINHILNNH